MSLLNDWAARGRTVLGADNAIWVKALDVAGDLAVNLIVAALIMVGAVFVSKWAAHGVSKGLGRLRVTRRQDATLAQFFATLTRWVVLIIGVIAVLQRLGRRPPRSLPSWAPPPWPSAWPSAEPCRIWRRA